MTTRERSVQQLYPLGGAASRPLSLIAASVAPFYAIVMAAHNRDDINAPLLAVASIVLVFAASLTVIVGSSPLRAPFTNQSALFTLLWANAAMLLGAASTWQTNAHVRDDWGPTVIGIMIIAIAPYRPTRELVIGGVLSSILGGFLVLLEVDSLNPLVPHVVFVIVTVSPILVLTIGAGRFTRLMIESIERWRGRARVIDSELDDDEELTVARSVQQDRVTILNRDIVPFFAAVLAQDGVTAADARRARAIAESVRAVMVAEADRSWLHLVVEQAASARASDWLAPDAVDDPQHLAPRMNVDQRSSLRAFVGSLVAHPAFSSRAFRISLSPHAGGVAVVLNARLDRTEVQVRSEFSPFFAVMRIMFDDLSYEFVQPVLTLRFSYDE